MHQLPCESCVAETPCVYVSSKKEDRFDTGSGSRNVCQKRTAIFIIVCLGLIGSIIGCIILLFTQKPISSNELKPPLTKNFTNHRITLDELLKDPLVLSRNFRISGWLFNFQFLVENEDNDLIVFTIKEGAIEGTTPKLFLNKKQINSAQTIFNFDGSMVAFLNKNEHSFPLPTFSCELAKVLDIDGIRHSLTLKNKSLTDIQTFQWNPISSDFVFVYKNDIYYQADYNKPEKVIRVTHSDSDFVHYGHGDWVIKEEILEKSIWWSKSGRYIAYASYDSRNTSKVSLTFESRHYNLSYPRPGDKYLHGVWLFIWDKVEQTRQFALPDDNLIHDSQNAIQYLFSAAWTNFKHLGEVLISIWANRNQNSIAITLCPINEQCFQFFKFKYNIDGKSLWAEPSTLTLKFFSSIGFFIILPKANSNGDIYDNIAHIDISQINSTNTPQYKLQIHSFAFDATEIVGYDQERDELFFTGQGGLIGEMHLFRIPTASANQTIEPQCVTCPIKDCNYATPHFSPNSKQILIHCESPYNQPIIYLKTTSDILKSYIIQSAKQQISQTSHKNLPSIRFESIELSNGLNAHVQILFPPNFNPKLKYPVLLSIYAGPNSNSVHRRSPNYLETYFSSSYSVLVLKIDGRGSGLRGWNLKHQIYRHLGRPEIEDQLETLKLLLERYPYMDANSISLTGWSYGGFSVLHASELDGGRLIKCAIAGGSVIDFHSAYTERYMGLPKDNKIGYMESSILRTEKLEVFSRIKLMIVHGLSDENVLFDINSGHLIRQLQLYNHNFTQQLYPNERHTLEGGKRHFITDLETFLSTKCFPP